MAFFTFALAEALSCSRWMVSKRCSARNTRTMASEDGKGQAPGRQRGSAPPHARAASHRRTGAAGVQRGLGVDELPSRRSATLNVVLCIHAQLHVEPREAGIAAVWRKRRRGGMRSGSLQRVIAGKPDRARWSMTRHRPRSLLSARGPGAYGFRWLSERRSCGALAAALRRPPPC